MNQAASFSGVMAGELPSRFLLPRARGASGSKHRLGRSLARLYEFYETRKVPGVASEQKRA
jgi:hypothetical protein